MTRHCCRQQRLAFLCLQAGSGGTLAAGSGWTHPAGSTGTPTRTPGPCGVGHALGGALGGGLDAAYLRI